MRSRREQGAEATGQMTPHWSDLILYETACSGILIQEPRRSPSGSARLRKRSSRFSAELPGRNLRSMDPHLPLEIGTICSVSSADHQDRFGHEHNRTVVITIETQPNFTSGAAAWTSMKYTLGSNCQK